MIYNFKVERENLFNDLINGWDLLVLNSYI